MSFQISIKKFRQAVDSIRDERDSILVKTAYLLAARNCELLTKTVPSDLLNNASKPYGNFLNFKFANYEVSPATQDKEAVMEKVFLVTMGVAKRGKRLKKHKEGEEQTTRQLKEAEVIEAFTKYNQTSLIDKWRNGEIEVDPLLIKVLLGEVTLKVVALPTSTVYEPWTLDILKWISKHKTIAFDLTRRRFIQILRENLSSIMPKVSKRTARNLLRHYRISHLSEYYNFDPMQITNFVGWSVASTARQMGLAVSANVDHYIHFRWREYFPKLLRPLADLN